MLQKGLDLILVSSIGEAKRRIFEDKEIELILCDLELPDGTAMELFHTLRRMAGMFQMKNPPVRLLPFFIFTENNDLATEYEYRHEGVNDYITAPVNIPELIRRVLFFVEWNELTYQNICLHSGEKKKTADGQRISCAFLYHWRYGGFE